MSKKSNLKSSIDDWIMMWYAYTMDYYLAPLPKKKKRNLAICDNIDGSRSYYGK